MSKDGPKRIFTVDEIIDVKAGTAPLLKLEAGTLVIVDSTALHFEEAGQYIIIAVDVWKNTVAKAIAKQEPRPPTDEELQEAVMQRQVRRAIQRRDLKN